MDMSRQIAFVEISCIFLHVVTSLRLEYPLKESERVHLLGSGQLVTDPAHRQNQ